MNPPKLLRRHLCFLDVGHGNCTVLIASDKDVIVVDVGQQNTLSEFLVEQGITSIRSIYLSHADADHIGALVGIIATNRFTIGKIFLNSDSSKNTKIWDDLMYALDKAQRASSTTVHIELVTGMNEQLCGNVCVDVLGPSTYLAGKGPGSKYRSGGGITSNTISAVIAIAVKGKRLALLPGDLDVVGLKDLQRTRQNLRAQILVYPHHGGLPGGPDPATFCGTLISAVSPNCVIFSIGRRRHNTPNPITVSLLRKVLPSTRIVCTQLSEHCSKMLPSNSPTHLSNAYAVGRTDGACCGGTIVVSLDDPNNISPSQTQHADFIRVYADTALCSRTG